MSANVLQDIERKILSSTKDYYRLKHNFMFENMALVDYLKAA
jgi:hypothetical protein